MMGHLTASIADEPRDKRCQQKPNERHVDELTPQASCASPFGESNQ